MLVPLMTTVESGRGGAPVASITVTCLTATAAGLVAEHDWSQPHAPSKIRNETIGVRLNRNTTRLLEAPALCLGLPIATIID